MCFCLLHLFLIRVASFHTHQSQRMVTIPKLGALLSDCENQDIDLDEGAVHLSQLFHFIVTYFTNYVIMMT